MMLYKCGHKHRERRDRTSEHKQSITNLLCKDCHHKQLRDDIARWTNIPVDKIVLSKDGEVVTPQYNSSFATNRDGTKIYLCPCKQHDDRFRGYPYQQLRYSYKENGYRYFLMYCCNCQQYYWKEIFL